MAVADLKNQGFSMLELMVAVGLMAVLGLGLSTAMTPFLKYQTLFHQKTQAEAQTLMVKDFLSKHLICKANITAGNFATIIDVPTATPNPLPQISFIGDRENHPLMAVNQVGSDSITAIKEMNLSDFRGIVPKIYSALLNIHFVTNKASGEQSFVRQVPLVLVTDASGKLIDCSASTEALPDDGPVGGSLTPAIDPDGRCPETPLPVSYRSCGLTLPSGFPTEVNCQHVCYNGVWRVGVNDGVGGVGPGGSSSGSGDGGDGGDGGGGGDGGE